MASVVAQAPVAFSLMTSAAANADATQIWQVSSAGVTAGLIAGNLYLDSPSSNLMNGRLFEVVMGGWVKAHGATQLFAPGIQIFPWNTSVAGAKTASGTATYTPVDSGTLTAGTFYDFQVSQKFFGEAKTNTLTCLAPVVYVAGSAVSISSVASPVTVSISTASQTEPGTGLSEVGDQNYPLASFAATFSNHVSDATETMQLTQFCIQLV